MKSHSAFIFRILDASSILHCVLVLSLPGRAPHNSPSMLIYQEEDTTILSRHCSSSESAAPRQHGANTGKEVLHCAISSSHQSLQNKQHGPNKTDPAILVLSLSVIMSKLHKTFLPTTSAKRLCQDDLRFFLAHESSLPSAVIF